MRREIISKNATLVVRRLVLEPGEAMPWHTDPCRRLTVVIRGERLAIEFRDGGELTPVPVAPGATAWDEPEPRVHRGVNVGDVLYEEVVVFFLPAEGADPQPEVAPAV